MGMVVVAAASQLAVSEAWRPGMMIVMLGNIRTIAQFLQLVHALRTSWLASINLLLEVQQLQMSV